MAIKINPTKRHLNYIADTIAFVGFALDQLTVDSAVDIAHRDRAAECARMCRKAAQAIRDLAVDIAARDAAKTETP